MSEQLNPINEEMEEMEAGVEAVEAAAPDVETAAEAAAETVTEPVVEMVAPSVEKSADDPQSAVRKVAGPPLFVARERPGRVRRIGNEVNVDEIDYRNIALLSRFLDQRGRIIPRRKTRVSAKVQRRIVRAVKRARHLALLPYTGEHVRITRKHG